MYMTEHCTFTLKETELKSCHVILRQDLFIDRTVCFPALKGRVYLGVIFNPHAQNVLSWLRELN